MIMALILITATRASLACCNDPEYTMITNELFPQNNTILTTAHQSFDRVEGSVVRERNRDTGAKFHHFFMKFCKFLQFVLAF